MLSRDDLDAVKKIVEDLLNKHMFTCPLGEGFTREELKNHSTDHREFKEYMITNSRMRKIWIYFLGLLVTIYIPLIIKLLWG